jgi:hypothetical protein
MLKILGEDLARICKNASMFTNPKSLYLPNEVLFRFEGTDLRVFATDDYFAISDVATLTAGKAEFSFVLDAKDIAGYTKDKVKYEGLEEFARRNKKNEIEISVGPLGVDFETNDEARHFPFAEYREDAWWVIEGLIFSDEIQPVAISHYRSNPERYAKLSQIKYDKDSFGIDWFHVETMTGNLLIRFKIGPTIDGVIRPLSDPPEDVT